MERRNIGPRQRYACRGGNPCAATPQGAVSVSHLHETCREPLRPRVDQASIECWSACNRTHANRAETALFESFGVRPYPRAAAIDADQTIDTAYLLAKWAAGKTVSAIEQLGGC